MASKNAKPSVDADNGNIEQPETKSGSSNDVSNGEQFTNPDNLGNPDEYARDANGDFILNKDGSRRKKRGRKPGSTGAGNRGSAGSRRKGGSRNSEAVDSLSATLLILHSSIANITKFKEFALDKQESDALAGSIANVMEQFDIVPDPRIAAVAGLVSTAGMIYGPRVVLYKMQSEAKKKEKSGKSEPDFRNYDGVIIEHDNLKSPIN